MTIPVSEYADLHDQIQQAKNLLAVIHRDGWHYTLKVGFEQSISDAIDLVVKKID